MAWRLLPSFPFVGGPRSWPPYISHHYTEYHTMTTKTTKPLNGISWMTADAWTKSQAAGRLEQQCPVTKKTQCIHREDPDEDPVLAAWNKAHMIEEANKPVSVPLPKFGELVRRQEDKRYG